VRSFALSGMIRPSSSKCRPRTAPVKLEVSDMPRVVEVAGQQYEFPDDAPDEAVMAFVNKHAPKPATTMDVLKAVPSNVLNNLAQGTKGSFSMLGDVGMASHSPALVLAAQLGKQLVKPGADAAAAAAKAD